MNAFLLPKWSDVNEGFLRRIGLRVPYHWLPHCTGCAKGITEEQVVED